MTEEAIARVEARVLVDADWPVVLVSREDLRVLLSLARQVGALEEALETISKGGPATINPPKQKTHRAGFDLGCEWAGNVARAALQSRSR